jgi:hypothetical protein
LRYSAAGEPFLIAPGGRDVVRGDRVAEQRQHPRALDVAQRLGLAREVLEVRAAGARRSIVVPREAVARRHLEPLPALVALEHLAVGAREHLPADRVLDRLRDLLRGRPDVGQEDLLAVVGDPERLVEQVDVHRPRERVGDDERRRREVVHLHVGLMRPSKLRLPESTEHDREVLGGDRLGDLLGQRSRVPDAGRAAVADEVEAELLEVGDQAGALVVLHDHLGAGRQRGLDPRLDLQAALDGLLGQ